MIMSDIQQVNDRLKIGMYWAASCGGCDIALLEIGENILKLVELADVVFWPCVADFKYADVAGYPDDHLHVCFFNGGIRNSEQEQVARMLRRKSQCLIAFGACASDGGIPALANLKTPKGIFSAAYMENPSLDNPGGLEPRPLTECPEGDLEIPRFYPQVLRLGDVVPVDYELPGCPPHADRVWETIEELVAGRLPLKGDGGKVGCKYKSVCDECPLEKRQVKIKSFKRPHEAIPEPGWCLLEQGFVCLGAATRSGCGARCLQARMPCRGCYGSSGVEEDQGMAMVAALGSLLDATTEEKAREMIDQLVDPAGTFYRFTLSRSGLRGRR
jgi:F420-non-reducing hydrogenase small subunit